MESERPSFLPKRVEEYDEERARRAKEKIRAMFDFSGIDDGDLAATRRRVERLSLVEEQPTVQVFDEERASKAKEKIRAMFDFSGVDDGVLAATRRRVERLSLVEEQPTVKSQGADEKEEEAKTFLTAAKLANVSLGLAGANSMRIALRNGKGKKRNGARKPALLQLYKEPCSEGALCECGCSRNRVEKEVLYPIDKNVRKTKRNRNSSGGDQKRSKTYYFPNLAPPKRRSLR
ncbi:hypothetical protein BSKO_04700 [Bryopsis sp. KO-2023]|nr:hypothetical protein BSKO_04700 [Bryopsis sp. KO-2023]